MPRKPKQKTARPVFPNAGVDAWYRTQLQTLVREMSQDLLDRVRAAWREGGGIAQDEAQNVVHVPAYDTLPESFHLTDAAMDARPKLSTSVLLQRALERWGGLWVKRLDKASVRIATNFAAKNRAATEASMMKTLATAGFTVKFKPTKLVRQAYDAVVAENIGLIKSIPQKYLGDVQNAVWQGVMQGSNLDAIADNLQEKYGIAHRRAALIARDQNHKAKAAIERAQRIQVGITKAKWQHSHAGKDPRPTHVAMDGEEYDIKKGMWDKAVQKRIWPGTEINCRCTDRPVIPGFET